MINNELLEWIRQQLGNGVSMDQVSRQLRAQGWNEVDLTEAYNALSKSLAEEEKSTPPPAAPVPTSGPNVIVQPTDIKSGSTTRRGLLPKLFAVLLVFSFLGGVGYAYWAKIGPFSNPPYTQDNLLSGLFYSLTSINSSTYSLTLSASTGTRDSDATPFVLKTTEDSDKIEKYKNDYQIASDVGTLLGDLLYAYGESSFTHAPYPASVEQFIKDNSLNLGANLGDKYSYESVDGGKNFKLAITFSTTDAVHNIRQAINSSQDKGTIIDGQTVIFNKDSSAYFIYSFPSELPKPFFTELQDYAVSLPAEMSVSTSLTATTDWTKTNADWKFNVNATGDFGDLSYKVNADALRKNEDIYFRINNFPSIFGFPPEILKGNWAKIEKTASTSIFAYTMDAEEQYKKNRADFVETLRRVVKVADETGLISIKGGPSSERMDGRILYRYDLEINKTAVSSFYQKIATEIGSNSRYAEIFSDPSIGDYTQSEGFEEVVDYFKKNTTITIWIDTNGLPVIVENSVRIVPPDTAVALKDKQINLKSTITISDINVPVDISAPTDAKSLDELMGVTNASTTNLE